MPQVTVEPNREEIQRRRLEAGLSPAMLAGLLPGNRHAQTIRKIESYRQWGQPRVSLLLIHQIANALPGTKASDLIKSGPEKRVAA